MEETIKTENPYDFHAQKKDILSSVEEFSKSENHYDFHTQKKEVLTVAHLNSDIDPVDEMQKNMESADNADPATQEYALTA
jgi:hypothetical protein